MAHNPICSYEAWEKHVYASVTAELHLCHAPKAARCLGNDVEELEAGHGYEQMANYGREKRRCGGVPASKSRLSASDWWPLFVESLLLTKLASVFVEPLVFQIVYDPPAYTALARLSVRLRASDKRLPVRAQALQLHVRSRPIGRPVSPSLGVRPLSGGGGPRSTGQGLNHKMMILRRLFFLLQCRPLI